MAQPTKGLLNPGFVYRPSWNTDIRVSIARERIRLAAKVEDISNIESGLEELRRSVHADMVYALTVPERLLRGEQES